jgi:transposase
MARVNQRYPQELRDRAVRLVLESRDDYESEWKAIESIAMKLGIGSTETLRKVGPPR